MSASLSSALVCGPGFGRNGWSSSPATSAPRSSFCASLRRASSASRASSVRSLTLCLCELQQDRLGQLSVGDVLHLHRRPFLTGKLDALSEHPEMFADVDERAPLLREPGRLVARDLAQIDDRIAVAADRHA